MSSTSCFVCTQLQVNPDLPESGNDGGAAEGAARGSVDGAARTKRGSAEARPGLMRTTFDEWDTLLVRIMMTTTTIVYIHVGRGHDTGRLHGPEPAAVAAAKLSTPNVEG